MLPLLKIVVEAQIDKTVRVSQHQGGSTYTKVIVFLLVRKWTSPPMVGIFNRTMFPMSKAGMMVASSKASVSVLIVESQMPIKPFEDTDSHVYVTAATQC